VGAVARPVTLADVAPTQAALLDFHFDAPDGEALAEVVSARVGALAPRLLVVLVWDAGGEVVLDAWPDAWPNLHELIGDGVWYDEAEVGSSPPSTAQIHTTIGTGAYSRTHGIVAHHFRIGDRLVSPADFGPDLIERPTLGDLYDRANANAPLVGAVATVDIQLGMVGHGSLWGGGDSDVVALRELGSAEALGSDGPEWTLPDDVADWYELPAYLNDLPPVSTYLRVADRADGTNDGTWRGHALDEPELLGGFQTPARLPWQQRAIEEMVRHEGFGDDEIPDLLFVNEKLIDEVGHLYSLNSLEMRDAVRAHDRALGRLVRFLDEEVGQGQWILTLTADHGHTPDPSITGATVISPTRIAATINGRFDDDDDDVEVVRFVQPTNVHLDLDELAENGGSLVDVAAYLLKVTKADVASPQYPVPPDKLDQPAFLAAYPSDMLASLPCLSRR
jgi:hypothetical protein